MPDGRCHPPTRLPSPPRGHPKPRRGSRGYPKPPRGCPNTFGAIRFPKLSEAVRGCPNTFGAVWGWADRAIDGYVVCGMWYMACWHVGMLMCWYVALGVRVPLGLRVEAPPRRRRRRRRGILRSHPVEDRGSEDRRSIESFESGWGMGDRGSGLGIRIRDPTRSRPLDRPQTTATTRRGFRRRAKAGPPPTFVPAVLGGANRPVRGLVKWGRKPPCPSRPRPRPRPRPGAS